MAKLDNMASWVTVDNIDMRNNLIAILRGDVGKVEELINTSHNQPLLVAYVDWGEERINIDSYMLSYVLYDALLFDKDDKDYSGRNIPEMLNLHMRMCGPSKHPDYSMFPFITWNDWDSYFDEEDVELLTNDGVSSIDIELVNEGMRHNEERVVELLKKGASPYFLNRTDAASFEDNGKQYHYGYFEVAPLLCQLDSEWCDQWDIRYLRLLRKDLESLDNEDLGLIVWSLFDAAASQRILYLVDKYINDEARSKGEELMRKYDVSWPILRGRPDSIID